MKNKKGFEKAIEIFIFFFIILIVGVIVLRMFKAQMATKTAEVADITQEEFQNQEIRSLTSSCITLCDEAIRNDCNTATKAAFCANNMGPLDLNGDGDTEDSSTLIGGGAVVCESNIYCPLVVGCKCGSEELTITNCDPIVDEHYNNIGLNSFTYEKGTCGATWVPPI